MKDKRVLNAIGMCRRAGKLGIGADAALDGIRHGAPAVVMASDISEGTRNRIAGKCGRTKIIELGCTMDEIEETVGRRFAVASINDENLARAVMIALNREEIADAD